ncbi:Glycosyltransferase involved in cell wall bisynthesis [Jatrophihabitans endophyticus]|uniref:Glycosyltransferase involved in cell wall bisynthesis n=1 Tax=Jatrophihabitans endophyticus TaxID=1206085 RepID=A0A1M5KLU4_9ACTN|nr:glycosyltransferase family 4 protein [Jatrophihabitans endophyticus]SHG53685.1 Glycosyltransferase involved in cell wall bisynthesis [Jatrophihabitans endophyticus]
MDERPLRIALTSYRSKPHCGGQGVYVRNLSRELAALGHRVEVFSGPPYPDLDAGVGLTEVPSLDLYDDAHPFRRGREFRDATDVLEFATMCTGGFPEPRTFSRRVVRVLRARTGEFDVVHDNQTLGPALLALPGAGLPLVGTIHHPISVDRALELAAASGRRRLSLRRWYGFVRTQARVARGMDLLLSPSRNSVADAIRDFGVRDEQFRVVPIGVDVERFRPRGERVPGRIVTMCSADVPLKGLSVLLRAMAQLRTSHASLTVVSRLEPGGRTEKLVAELGLAHRVSFVSGLGDDELAELLASAEVACVPSLYEGFSLPAVEAMASGTPLVASDAGALPEVVGRDGTAGLLVPAGDPVTLARRLDDLFAAPEQRARLGAAARERARTEFSWGATARATAGVYREAIARHRREGAR